MGSGLEYIKTIDKNYRDTLILMPSGMPYTTMTCPYKNAPCSMKWCALFDVESQLCGMLLTYLQTTKMLNTQNKNK